MGVKMKKLITVLMMGALLASSVFAMDLSVGLKGIVGNDNSTVKGATIGGGFDINLDIKNGFGLEIQSNIVPSKLTSTDDGLTFVNHMSVNIPVMAWYNAKFSWFGLGLGAGISCTMSENHPVNASNTKMGLAAGLQTKIFVTKDIAIVAGITGNLDCFPILTKTEKENSTTYKFVESDFSRNSFYGSIGIEYKFAL
jgi:hypothetical protein